MIDPQILPLVRQQVPKFNPIVANGYAMYEVSQVMQYINQLLISASNNFPEGLVYTGISRADPFTEYNALIKNRTYNISKSTVYVVKIGFEYKGEPLTDRYMLLPYLNEGGTMMISGSTFAVTPVLIDKAFSVGTDSIFLHVNRAKLTFEQISHIYLENNERRTEFTVTSDIYFGRNSIKIEAPRLRPTYKMDLLAVHYLLARDGLVKLFKESLGIDVWYGDSTTINVGNYPYPEYTICSSTKQKPQKLNVPNYHGSDFRIAVKTADINASVRCTIAGLFYVVDWYPERVKPELLEDNKLWYLLLALTIKPEVMQEMATIEKLDDHFSSIKTFIDDQVRETLESEGIIAKDVFDILVNLIYTYPERINIDTSTLASMYGKRLAVLRYFMEDVRKNIYYMAFGLQGLINSNKPFGKMEIEYVMKKNLKPSTILKASGHPEVNAISNPTDNVVPVMTLPVKQQNLLAKKGSRKTSFVYTDGLALSASIAEVGNPTSDAKEDFTGRSRLNPYLLVAPDGSVLRNPDLVAVIDKTEREIQVT